MFRHFLITRFNLKKKDWTTNKKDKAVLTEEWHKNRFELFTNFCFPSVASQVNTNFEWLVFFDTTTSKTYREIIKDLEKKLPNFKPLFIDGMDQFLPTVKNYVANQDFKYIITSGLDNDDCLSTQYVESVQQQFNNQNFLALDFVDGYTLQISPNYKLGKKLHQYNPFISLIEKNDNPITVSNVSHRLWKKEKRILQIKNQRIWSSVIHLENKVNEFTGFGTVDTELFFENFKIATTKETEIKKQLIPLNKWYSSSVYNATTSKWNYFFKNLKKSLGLYKSK